MSYVRIIFIRFSNKTQFSRFYLFVCFFVPSFFIHLVTILFHNKEMKKKTHYIEWGISKKVKTVYCMALRVEWVWAWDKQKMVRGNLCGTASSVAMSVKACETEMCENDVSVCSFTVLLHYFVLFFHSLSVHEIVYGVCCITHVVPGILGCHILWNTYTVYTDTHRMNCTSMSMFR